MKNVINLRLSKTPAIDSTALHARIHTLAADISARFVGCDVVVLVVLVVLKGAVPFSVDLLRQLHVPLLVEYIRAKSYAGTTSTGEVVFSHLPEEPLQGRHVLVVEDILDTGHTAETILSFVRAQNPASVTLAVLLDKPSRRKAPVTADYVGFEIEDHFVVGYGLDYNERYRELDAIYTLET